MTHTKKRILSLLLAVVLMFSALPFSVSADEITRELPTESTLESQPEETEEPAPAENTITISDSSGDVPVLRAQDPFNTVKSEVEGGTNYMTSVGVTREAIVRELESHENDDFYLGTKYVGGDAQSPNGDTSYNSGTADELRRFYQLCITQSRVGCGNHHGDHAPNTRESVRLRPALRLAGRRLQLQKPYRKRQYQCLAFRTKQELLSSGLAEKGDIILMWWSDTPGTDSADNHIGFFWGEASDDDVMCTAARNPALATKFPPSRPRRRAASTS